MVLILHAYSIQVGHNNLGSIFQDITVTYETLRRDAVGGTAAGEVS